MARKSISKKLRFEVFKRDGFRCQYCGRAAPDIVLEIDHIKPVADGGENDILNLITSCKDCNSGKGDRSLTENTTLAKQRDQLEELNERREQLEMMIQWKEELSKLKDDVVDRLSQHWSKLVPGYSLNENGLQAFKKLTKQFDLHEILDAMQTAVDQYVTFHQGKPDQESVELSWKKVPGICRTRRAEKSKPYLRDLYYIRGILRNRVYVNENYVLELLEEAVLVGADIESLKNLAKRARNWTEFREDVEAFIRAQRESA
jgi:hypothetical protein